MEALFLKLLNMSLSAGWLVLAVVLLRLLLKKAPKAFRCVLWGLVALRLVWPFSFESMLSLLPSAEPVPQDILFSPSPAIDSGLPVVDEVINPILTQTSTPAVVTSVNPLQIWTWLASWVWVAGMLVMVLYTILSYWRLRRRIAASVWHRSNIWLCDYIDTPFILGVVKPRIYLPSSMEEGQAQHVIAHENAHLARRDHWWKPLGFILLTVYWFHPLMWVAYLLLCRDIELACDERVIRHLDVPSVRAYSDALLSCSVPRRLIAACPLAFGEVGVKERIRSVLHYKKPTFWMMVAAAAACILAAVCFLTDPVDYDPQIRYGGVIWEQSGFKTEALPDDSTQVGMLKGIVHRTHDLPEADLYAVNLDEKYAGCPLWRWEDTLYLQDYGGGYLPFAGAESLRYGHLYHLDAIHYAADGYEGLAEQSLLYAFTDDLQLMVQTDGGPWKILGVMEPFRLTKSSLEDLIRDLDDGFVANGVAEYYRRATENAWRLEMDDGFYYFWDTSAWSFLVYGSGDAIHWVAAVLPVTQYQPAQVLSAAAAPQEGDSRPGTVGHVTDTLFIGGHKYRADGYEILLSAEELSARLQGNGRYWAEGTEIPHFADADGQRMNVYPFYDGDTLLYRIYQFPGGTCWLSVGEDETVYELEPAAQAASMAYEAEQQQVLALFSECMAAEGATVVDCIPFEAAYQQQGLYGVVLYYEPGSGLLQQAIIPADGCFSYDFSINELAPGTWITYLGDLKVEYYTVDDEGQYWHDVKTYTWDAERINCSANTSGRAIALTDIPAYQALIARTDLEESSIRSCLPMGGGNNGLLGVIQYEKEEIQWLYFLTETDSSTAAPGNYREAALRPFSSDTVQFGDLLVQCTPDENGLMLFTLHDVPDSTVTLKKNGSIQQLHWNNGVYEAGGHSIATLPEGYRYTGRIRNETGSISKMDGLTVYTHPLQPDTLYVWCQQGEWAYRAWNRQR